MIGKITHRIVKQHAVNEDDPPDEVTFLLVRIHVSHRRFYGSECRKSLAKDDRHSPGNFISESFNFAPEIHSFG